MARESRRDAPAADARVSSALPVDAFVNWLLSTWAEDAQVARDAAAAGEEVEGASKAAATIGTPAAPAAPSAPPDTAMHPASSDTAAPPAAPPAAPQAAMVRDLADIPEMADLPSVSSSSSAGPPARLYRTDELAVIRKIGEGFYGRVFHCQDKMSLDHVAVKEYKADLADPAARAQFVKEFGLQRALFHPNVLQFRGVYFHQGHLHLVTEFASNGTLLDRIRSGDPLSWLARLSWSRDLAHGMQYLHERRIIHRDLKSENCLIRSDQSLVISDFGLSRRMADNKLRPLVNKALSLMPTTKRKRSSSQHDLSDPVDELLLKHQQYTSKIGTPYYMAPEMFIGGDYDEMVDLFSFGIINAELISRQFADPDVMPRTCETINGQFVFGLDAERFIELYSQECPPEFLNLTFSCCALEPTQRPTFAEAAVELDELVEAYKAL
eukprot:m.301917 g.301917  ORF g.301917 m.301917 type:complete len:439 (-) comp14966_c0_seq1:442-1758(-)